MADQTGAGSAIPALPQKVENLLGSPAFKNLNHQQRTLLKRELNESFTVSASVSQSYSGPLPPPEVLNQFNQVLPNGAERIMVMVEQQNKHRMSIETTVINNQQWQSTLGQYFALGVTLIGLTLAAFSIFFGHDWAGGTIGVATISSVAMAFITGRKKQETDLRSKK
jgi:uncharacterized membrane protein